MMRNLEMEDGLKIRVLGCAFSIICTMKKRLGDLMVCGFDVCVLDWKMCLE